MPDMREPVLIVGGGIAGLSSALFLSWHQIPCVLVERHPALLLHPRARGLTPRTMELYRQVGLDDRINAVAYGGPDFVWAPILADTLNDETYHQPDEPVEDDGTSASPCRFGPIDQDKLEALVRARATELGADLRFGHELTSFEQNDTAVTAVVNERATGAEYTIHADYLIAADGIGGWIRERLGIGVQGPGPLFQTITAIVDADLNPALRGRNATIAYLQKPQPFTIMMAHDGAGRRWVFGTGYDPSVDSLADFTDDWVADLVRAAAGLPDLQVTLRPQIPGTDLRVLGFPIVARIADVYRDGRAFLVGDAAHAWPPTGGLGANAGIQDAHNLAWKLAAVLSGQSGVNLLDSYEDERRPTGLRTMTQAMARFGTRMDDGRDDSEVVEYGAIAMGYQYRSTAVLTHDDNDDPIAPTRLTGAAGTRAPHAEVRLNGHRISTLDLYGRNFVLLAGSAAHAWTDAAEKIDMPLDAYRFGSDITPADAANLHGIGEHGAILVRPDGYAAWRTTTTPPDPAAVLREVLDAILSEST